MSILHCHRGVTPVTPVTPVDADLFRQVNSEYIAAVFTGLFFNADEAGRDEPLQVGTVSVTSHPRTFHDVFGRDARRVRRHNCAPCSGVQKIIELLSLAGEDARRNRVPHD